MQFILAPENIAKLDNLRVEYQKKRDVDLDRTQPILGRPTFFGGTDVPTRKKQVEFLEKIKTVLQLNLFDAEDMDTPNKWQANLIASKTIIAACIYVLNQIGSSKRNSALYATIEDFLGVTPTNFFDEEDIEACYITANRLMHTNNAFEHSNHALIAAGKNPFTEKEWNKFSKFLKDSCSQIESAHNKQPNSFPMISITQPLFGSVFSYVGASVGLVAAEALSNSTSAVASRLQLTAFVGSTLLVFSPAGAAGVALFAPVIATKLMSSFCSISLAHAMGTSMGILGQGIGIGVGAPFDLTYNLLWKICSTISRYYTKTPHLAEINGIRIADGVTVIAGIPIQALPANALPQGYTQKLIEINDAGEVRIDGKLIENSEPMQMPAEVMNELQEHLAEISEHEKEEEALSM